MLEWTQAATTHTATNTNINVQADKFPAPVRTRCAP